jgi:hypothetical protein
MAELLRYVKLAHQTGSKPCNSGITTAIHTSTLFSHVLQLEVCIIGRLMCVEQVTVAYVIATGQRLMLSLSVAVVNVLM